MKRLLILTAIGGLASGAVAATAPREERIPFADRGAIRNWQADGDRALYLQGDGPQWYHVTTLGTCRDLPFADAIGFQAGGIGDFDRFSTLIVRGQRCAVSSVVKSAPPPAEEGTQEQALTRTGVCAAFRIERRDASRQSDLRRGDLDHPSGNRDHLP